MSQNSSTVRKPMNCFFRYKQYIRPKLFERYGKLPKSEMSKMISTAWKNESPEIKNYFVEQSKEAFAEHKRLYPNFVWPSKASKSRRNSQKSISDSITSDDDLLPKTTPKLTISTKPVLNINPYPTASADDSLFPNLNIYPTTDFQIYTYPSANSDDQLLPNLKIPTKPDMHVLLPSPTSPDNFQFDDFKTGWTPTKVTLNHDLFDVYQSNSLAFPNQQHIQSVPSF
ncbi:hypothetical protein BC833DRAFT_591968 [Globomyces pollinis-pini]|nr:hypothetical protein BC833DRAFT_591968 [Globomyces pollinis-pini]